MLIRLCRPKDEKDWIALNRESDDHLQRMVTRQGANRR